MNLFGSVLIDAFAAMGCVAFMLAGGVVAVVALALNSAVGKEAAARFFGRAPKPPSDL